VLPCGRGRVVPATWDGCDASHVCCDPRHPRTRSCCALPGSCWVQALDDTWEAMRAVHVTLPATAPVAASLACSVPSITR